jgi:hypothetical protein
MWNIGASLVVRGEEAVTALYGWIRSKKNRLRREKKENRKTIS